MGLLSSLVLFRLGNVGGFFSYCIFHLFLLPILENHLSLCLLFDGPENPVQIIWYLEEKQTRLLEIGERSMDSIFVSTSISIVCVRDNGNEIEPVFGAFCSLSHHILISVVCNGCDVISWLVLTTPAAETEATYWICRCSSLSTVQFYEIY